MCETFQEVFNFKAKTKSYANSKIILQHENQLNVTNLHKNFQFILFGLEEQDEKLQDFMMQKMMVGNDLIKQCNMNGSMFCTELEIRWFSRNTLHPTDNSNRHDGVSSKYNNQHEMTLHLTSFLLPLLVVLYNDTTSQNNNGSWGSNKYICSCCQQLGLLLPEILLFRDVHTMLGVQFDYRISNILTECSCTESGVPQRVQSFPYWNYKWNELFQSKQLWILIHLALNCGVDHV